MKLHEIELVNAQSVTAARDNAAHVGHVQGTERVKVRDELWSGERANSQISETAYNV